MVGLVERRSTMAGVAGQQIGGGRISSLERLVVAGSPEKGSWKVEDTGVKMLRRSEW